MRTAPRSGSRERLRRLRQRSRSMSIVARRAANATGAAISRAPTRTAWAPRCLRTTPLSFIPLRVITRRLLERALRCHRTYPSRRGAAASSAASASWRSAARSAGSAHRRVVAQPGAVPRHRSRSGPRARIGPGRFRGSAFAQFRLPAAGGVALASTIHLLAGDSAAPCCGSRAAPRRWRSCSTSRSHSSHASRKKCGNVTDRERGTAASIEAKRSSASRGVSHAGPRFGPSPARQRIAPRGVRRPESFTWAGPRTR